MPDELDEVLDCEARTWITRTMANRMKEIARERGVGVRQTQLFREAIAEFIEKHWQPPEKKP